MKMQIKYLNNIIIILSIIALFISLYNWWNDLIIESTYLGLHTKKVQDLLTNSYILFIISEVVIFISLLYIPMGYYLFFA